jgi:cyclopropane-fatty-acyl-phospholipid synthase
LGIALVAGKNLVPHPATGKTAFLIIIFYFNTGGGKMIENLVKNLAKFVEGGLSVELYDGRVIGEGKCKVVVVKDPKVIRDIIRDPEMGFGEHYMKGNIQIIGDLEKFLRGCMKYLKDGGEKLRFMPFRSLLKVLGLLKFVEEKEVQRHYDLGNDFYSLWLDSSMTYSCAFFKSPDCTLEEAQEEKRRIIYEKPTTIGRRQAFGHRVRLGFYNP